jgi:alpha-beta hydrolase superfamily lysophospholipase
MSRLLPFLLLATSGCVAGNAVTGALIRPMRVPVIGSPSLAHEDFEVTTEDGIALDGWQFSPAHTPRAVIFLIHGKDINRQHFIGAAERFVNEGYAVVAFDQRAHGRSTGEFITFGAKEVGDLEAVIDTSLTKWGRTLPVVVIGESLGAAVALQTAAVDPRIRAVVAGAAFADLTTVIDDHTPFFLTASGKAKAVKLAEDTAHFHVADISPERSARDIHVPTLLLCGSEDQFLPLKHSLRIYDALAGPKSLVRLEGVDHIGVLLSAAAWDSIDDFVDAALTPGADIHRTAQAEARTTTR